MTQIKRIATSKAAPHYDSNESIRVSRKKRDSTGVITKDTQQGKKTPNYHGAQWYCVIFKKAEMPEQKYMLHIPEDFFGSVPTKSPSRMDWEEP